MTRQLHVDGTLVPATEATVNVRDRGFMYGDAAFETLRAYGGEVFEFDAHAERLVRTAEQLGFDEALPPRPDLRDRIQETLTANDLTDAYLKISVSRGVQPGTLDPEPRVDPTIVVYARELPRGGTEGEPVWTDPATLETVDQRQAPAEVVPPGAKTHNYLPNILARLATDEADEALLRSLDGTVCEGAASNLFFVSDGTLYTPTANLPLLPGVTRGVVLDLARRESFPVQTGRYTLTEVHGAEELFLTNSTWEVRPVTTVDGLAKPVGPITKLCRRLFAERVERAHYQD